MNRIFAALLVWRREIWRGIAAVGWWWLLIGLAIGCGLLSTFGVLSLTHAREWFTGEKYITLATWGLVVATVILFLDSIHKGQEQRERWKLEDASRAKEQADRWAREDRLREEDAKPKVAVELARREGAPEIVVRCFNLGNTIFFIDQMVVTFTHQQTVNTGDLVGPPVLLPGTFTSTTYDCSRFLTDGFQEANVVFVLRGSHGLVSTGRFGSMSILTRQLAMDGREDGSLTVFRDDRAATKVNSRRTVEVFSIAAKAPPRPMQTLPVPG